MTLILDLDNGYFCRKVLDSRSRFKAVATRRCHKPHDHGGTCNEFPFLDGFRSPYPKVAEKIERDSIMTTGAAWKSEEAGPNRILRWVMLLNDEELKKYEIDMTKLKPQVVAKLREKAADYDSCVRVAMWLAYLAYQMRDAPLPPEDIRRYLQDTFGQMTSGFTTCAVCLLPLSFNLFGEARRGKASIETCHKDPRLHSPANVGFAHRECNIAQGPKSVEEFYDWIIGIIRRARPEILR